MAARSRGLVHAALRQQLAVLRRSNRRPRLHPRDRIFWVWLSKLWGGWRDALLIVRPQTVVKWHRQGLKLYWRGKSTRPKVGSIRRECLDHVIVLSEAHLLRVLGEYFDYYHSSRPHLSLACNAPIKREIEPPALGRVVAEPQVGGLHHRYRRAA